MTKSLSMILWSGASLLSACASLEQQPDGYSTGWRRGQVLEIVRAGNSISAVVKDCREALPSGASYAQFAVVSYSFGGDPNLRKKLVVSVPAGLQGLGAGDWVSVNVADCALPLKRLPPA